MTPRSAPSPEDNSSPEDPHNPDSRHNRHKHGGAAPVTWRCTRYVAVHPNRRGALPTDRVQCPNKQEQTRNWHTEPLTATPLHAHLDPTGGRMGTPPTPPPALLPTPTPPTPLHAKSPLTCAQVCPERHLTGRRRDLWERTRPPSRNTWKCPHQRVLSNSPRLPNVADSGSRVPNPLHKEAGGVHSYAAGMLFLRVRGCGVDAPPFVFSVQ